MLEIVEHIKSHKGHSMVKVFCHYCEEISEKRLTALKNIKSCGCRAYEYLHEIDKVYENKAGCKARVLEYLGKSRVVVSFEGYSDYPNCEFRLSHLKSGSFKNPWKRNIFGVGFDGVQNSVKLPYRIKIKHIWHGMLERCYKTDNEAFKFYGRVGVYVEDKWLNFYNFYLWYMDNWINKEINMHLDKDLLSAKGSKVYSESTCCLLPKGINSLLVDNYIKGTGNKRLRVMTEEGKRVDLGTLPAEEAFLVHKMYKEQRVKAAALESKNILHPNTYQKLMDWEYSK